MANARLEIVEMTNELRRELAANKPPSPAEVKRADALEAKAAGRATLGDTIARAKTVVGSLTKAGGMTTTAKGAISNTITSLQASGLGQTLGRIVGTNEQALRDQYASLRLQLLNDVKAATGMSATQMNSNVELQTWLSSLGAPGMTKEANEAILDSIMKKYVEVGEAPGPSDKPPTDPNAPLGSAANPIKLGKTK